MNARNDLDVSPDDKENILTASLPEQMDCKNLTTSVLLTQLKQEYPLPIQSKRREKGGKDKTQPV